MTEVFLYEIIKSDILPLLQEQPQVLQRISNVLNQRQMNTDQITTGFAHRKRGYP